MNKASLALSVLLLSITLPARAEDVGSIVAQLDATYDKTWNTLDSKQLAGLFSQDAIFLPAAGPATTGPAAVEAFFGTLWKDKWSEHKLEPITSKQISDNVIVASSRWSAYVIDANGQKVKYGGDVAQVFEKDGGGQWKAKLISFNILPDRK